MEEAQTLAELAEETGLPPRTIRFYIARGLLEGPVKAGRGAAYNSGHRKRLEKIKRLQTQGWTLTEILGLLAGGARPRAVSVSPWQQYAVSEDVLIWARADASPWRQKQIRDAIGEVAARLSATQPQSRERQGVVVEEEK